MQSLIEKYGKQTMEKLLSMMVIKSTITSEEMYQFLLDNKVITKRTKEVYVSFRKFETYMRLTVTSRSKQIFNFPIYTRDIQYYMEMLA